MSASSKKKLRKEQYEAALTEKQQKAQKDAKSLKRYTLIFAVSMLLIVALVIGIVLYNPIDRALDNSSVALSVGDYKVNTTMLSYYYVDEINAYYTELTNEYGDNTYIYAALLGLDLTQPLDKQEFPDEEGLTWAEYFIRQGITKAHRRYSLYLEATEAGHKLTEEEENEIDDAMATLDLYARYYYGYSSLDSYLRACYGNSATEETYLEYETINAIAESYYNSYYDGQDYDSNDYREYEKEKPQLYNAYTYSVYQIMYSNYLNSEDAVKDENGYMNYTEAQKEAARKSALADAEELLKGNYKDIEAFDAAISALAINKDKTVSSTLTEDQIGNGISSEELSKWLFEEREEGDLTMIPINAEEDGKEVINGYYVIRYKSMSENLEQMVNIRHILLDIKTVEDEDGHTSFDEEDKAKVLEDAQKILEDFRNGSDTSPEAFGKLATEKSVDGTKTTGGVVEDIYIGMMADELKDFEAWCFEEGRKAGDTDIVLSEYGYHIIYFESYDELNYRDAMIDGAMRAEAADKWATEIVEDYKLVEGDLARLDTSLIMGQ